MKKIVVTTFLIFASQLLSAQDKPTVKDTVAKKSNITRVNQTAPMYPGGLKALHVYLQDKLQPLGFTSQLEGKMILTFIVERNGMVTDVKIKQGIEKELNLAVMKILRESPRWIPGTEGGKTIRVQYVLPITF